jgi:hypothetical protein
MAGASLRSSYRTFVTISSIQAVEVLTTNKPIATLSFARTLLYKISSFLFNELGRFANAKSMRWELKIFPHVIITRLRSSLQKNLSWEIHKCILSTPNFNMKPILLGRSWRSLLPRANRLGRHKIGASSVDDTFGEDVLEFDCRQIYEHADADLKMNGNDDEGGLFENYEDSDRYIVLEPSPTRCRKSVDMGEDPTDFESDEDTLTDLLGGPYQPPKECEEVNVVHLKYMIPRRKIEVAEESTEQHKRSRNLFKKLGFKRASSLLAKIMPIEGNTPKFNSSMLFQRTKGHGPQYEETPTRSTTTSEQTLHITGTDNPPTINRILEDAEGIVKMTETKVGDSNQLSDMRAFGSRLEWPTKSSKDKSMMQMKISSRKDGIGMLSSISLDESSDESSLSESSAFDSLSEIISVSLYLRWQQNRLAPSLTQPFVVPYP